MRRGSSDEDVLGRYPGLLSQEEDEVFAALCELRSGADGEDEPKLVAHSGRGPAGPVAGMSGTYVRHPDGPRNET